MERTARPHAQTASTAMLSKTKMCKFHAAGNCTKGASCSFAHTQSDLQGRPDLQKTNLCLAFQRNGFCREGSACKYAHGQEELRLGAPKEQTAAVTQGVQPGPLDSVPTIMHGLPVDAFALASSISVPTSKGIAVEQFLKDNNTWGKENLSMDAYSANPALISYVSTTCSVASEECPSESILQDIHDLRQSTTSPCPESLDERSSAETTGIYDIGAGQHNAKLAAEKALDVRFEKTKMCKFFAQGVCSKGNACRFAHEKSALQSQPDLFRTRLCTAFIKNGKCKNGESCRYAHSPDQLRTDTIQEDSKAKTESSDCATSKDTKSCESIGAAMQSTSPFDASGLKLMVKNTFIHVQIPRSTSVAHRRTASAGSRLSH